MIEIAGGLAAVIALVLVNGFFVASEFSLVTVRRTRIEQLVKEGVPGSGSLADGVGNLDSYIAACQFGITVSSLALGWIGEPALAHLIEPVLGTVASHTIAVVVAFLVVTTLLTVAGELAPKGIALQYPERCALICAPPLRLFRAAFHPVVWALNEAGWIASRSFGVHRGVSGGEAVNADELRLVVRASRDAGEIDPAREDMLQRAIRFPELRAANVMTPRPKVVGIPATVTVAGALEIAREHLHSRYPVYGDDLDDLQGVLYVRDLLLASPGATVGDIARKPLLAPEQIGVDDLLRLIRDSHVQLAALVDEHGGTAGIVTLEDLIEEIVGDVTDEFETKENVAAPAGHPGRIEIDAAEPVQTLTEAAGVPVGGGPYATVAGFIMDKLHEMPATGRSILVGEYEIVITGMDGRRIAQVEVRSRTDDEMNDTRDIGTGNVADGTDKQVADRAGLPSRLPHQAPDDD